MRRPRAWLQVILLLIGYIAVSSVLGLIWWVGPFGVLVVWWTSIAADVVFVIGSIAGAVVGVTVTRSRRNSIALSGLIACLTYGIAAEVALSAFGALVGVGSPPPDDFPNLGMVLVDAPLLGIAGVAFAAVAPALLRERVKRFLEADAEPSTK